MAASTINLEKKVAIDPKVNVEETFSPVEIISKGGINKSIFQMNADSYSDQILVWNNITPPALTTCVERSLRVRYYVYVKSVYVTADAADSSLSGYFPATTNGAPYKTALSGVLRAFPLQSATSSVELRINGNATSVSINDYVCMFPHLLSNDEVNRQCSEFPCQKDDSSLYTLVGADLRSPFAIYGSNTTVPSRGSFTGQLLSTQATANATTTDTYVFEVVEQLLISPATFGDGMDGMGLSMINNLTLNVRIADVNRMVSVLPSVLAANNTSVAVSIANVWNANGTVGGAGFRPQLLLEYITPDPVISSRMPEQLVYNYELVQPFITPTGTQWLNTTNPVSSLASQSIRISSIPDKIYVFARPSKGAINTATLAQQTPDTFLRITGMKLNYNNRINLFATYTEKDLYKMSVSNGLQDSFHDWAYRSGSIVCIDVSKDICLESDECAGQANKYSTLQCYVDLSASPLAYSGNGTQLPYDLYIVICQNGKAVISKSSCDFLLTAPSGEEVLAVTADVSAKVDASDVNTAGKVDGGSLFGTGAKLLHRGLDFLASNPQHLKKASEMIKERAGAVVGGSAHKKKSKRVY